MDLPETDARVPSRGSRKSWWISATVVFTCCTLPRNGFRATLSKLLYTVSFHAASGAESFMNCTVKHGHLPRGFNLVRHKQVAVLRRTPVRRDLAANPLSQATFTTKRNQNIIALFIQLSGYESHARCLNCVKGDRVRVEYVVTTARSVCTSTKCACVNCFYNGLESKGSFRNGFLLFPLILLFQLTSFCILSGSGLADRRDSDCAVLGSDFANTVPRYHSSDFTRFQLESCRGVYTSGQI